jgi:hypothetical protein
VDAALRAQIDRFGAAIDRNAEGADGRYSRHPRWLYRVDSWVQRVGLELLKVAKAYARGETDAHPSVRMRRRHSQADAPAPVREKYNDFLRHLRGSGPQLLVSSHSRCF